MTWPSGGQNRAEENSGMRCLGNVLAVDSRLAQELGGLNGRVDQDAVAIHPDDETRRAAWRNKQGSE